MLPGAETADRHVEFRSVSVGGVKVFYREAGPRDAPTVLLLHGFPSSSRMYMTLMPLLADRYHVVAPDYPGFGHSDAPAPSEFAYTFDHLAEVIEAFTTQLQLARYTLYLQDYGGPVGMRLALSHPERVEALVIQNAVAHDEGLSPLWEARRAFFTDRSAHEERVRQNLVSPEATRQRHLGSSPHPERIDPDSWTDELAFLQRPGMGQLQLELFYDYRTNLENYPKWQQYLTAQKPNILVLWGKYDPSFTVAGATAYAKDVADAEVHLLEAGHFALDERPEEIAALMRRFLDEKVSRSR